MKIGDKADVCVIHEDWVYTRFNHKAHHELCLEAIKKLINGEKIDAVVLSGVIVGFSNNVDNNPDLKVTKVHYIHDRHRTKRYIGNTMSFHPHWYELGKIAVEKLLREKKEKVEFT